MFVWYLPQVHSCSHAYVIQHTLQLQEEGHSHDFCRLDFVFCYIMSTAVWTQ